jgi:hypothetical protein
MQRPLIERLSQAHERRLHTGEIDLNRFAAVVNVDEPLPETDRPLVHAEEDFDLPIDNRAKRLPPKPTILSLVYGRLNSLKPQTDESQQQLKELQGTLLPTLQAIDEFVTTMEDEHFEAIDKRWELVRQRGREIVDSIPELEQEWGAALNFSNLAQETKQQRRADLEQKWQEQKRICSWATKPEIAAADQKLWRAQNAARVAGEQAFERKRELAVAESKLVSARETLRLLKLEMKRLEAELRGENYFDPSLGLSKDPKWYRDKW